MSLIPLLSVIFLIRLKMDQEPPWLVPAKILKLTHEEYLKQVTRPLREMELARMRAELLRQWQALADNKAADEQ